MITFRSLRSIARISQVKISKIVLSLLGMGEIDRGRVIETDREKEREKENKGGGGEGGDWEGARGTGGVGSRDWEGKGGGERELNRAD